MTRLPTPYGVAYNIYGPKLEIGGQPTTGLFLPWTTLGGEKTIFEIMQIAANQQPNNKELRFTGKIYYVLSKNPLDPLYD